MKAYSRDLRERVVRAVDEGKSRDEISAILGVSRSTIKRYVKQRKEQGDLAPKAIPGRPARKGDALCAELLPQLEANRDATLEEHCQIWKAEQGQEVSAKTRGRAIKRMGWTRKKSRWWPPSATKRRGQSGERNANPWIANSWSSSMNAGPISR
ncbi:MAG TPA: transposase [Ktedonobacteraceae bacterium]|nr:transposase [Ktedonobacteraceae bacterium]